MYVNIFKPIYLLLIVIIFSIYGCGKQGPEGKKSLIDLINEPVGANCATGGYKIVSGVDLNNDDILSESEIQSTKYICNGANGNNSLAALVPEPAGPNCATGGYKVNTGIDLNNNNILDTNEVVNSEYICSGLNGNNSLVALVAEPAGLNCSNGGYKVNSGTDSNKNGVLEKSEIQSTSYICNGNNGLNYLISVKSESAGTNCTYGGYSFNTGIDVNKNGILDVNEITGTVYICNNTAINEIRIPLDFSANTTSTAGVSGLAISNFNKANYTGLDSIVFVARPYSGNSASNAIIDLVNLTDNIIWNDSRLTSNKPYDESESQTSKNLYNIIPDKPINIGLRVRSEKQGAFAGAGGTNYLILYHKE
ncbi:hypothetical protein FFF34_006420 [Inquilinus sp. KBS0705]|nr:hypothetical protein FFF34_006420 [Inquilinus sp. KBS0705]